VNAIASRAIDEAADGAAAARYPRATAIRTTPSRAGHPRAFSWFAALIRLAVVDEATPFAPEVDAAQTGEKLCRRVRFDAMMWPHVVSVQRGRGFGPRHTLWRAQGGERLVEPSEGARLRASTP